MTGTGVLCYPDQAKLLARDAGKLAVKNARIAYHFIVGGTKIKLLKSFLLNFCILLFYFNCYIFDIKSAARPSIQNENGKPFERVVGMTSDMGKWGYSLFQKKNPTNVESEVVMPEPAPESQPEENKLLDKSDTTVEVPAPAEVKEDPLPSEIIAEVPVDPSTTNSPEPNNEVTISANAVEVSTTVPESLQIPEENMESVSSDPSTTTSCPEIVPTEDVKILEAEIAAQIEKDIIVVEEPKKEEELKTASSPATTTVYEGDLGQGTLEDKELYTTRE